MASELLLRYGQDLGDFYNGEATDWNRLAQLAEAAQASLYALYCLGGSHDILCTCGGMQELRDAVYGLGAGLAEFTEAKTAFENLLEMCIRDRSETYPYPEYGLRCLHGPSLQ